MQSDVQYVSTVEQTFMRMLMLFKTINGHCDAPEAEGVQDKILHSWVLRQRQKRKMGTVGDANCAPGTATSQTHLKTRNSKLNAHSLLASHLQPPRGLGILPVSHAAAPHPPCFEPSRLKPQLEAGRAEQLNDLGFKFVMRGVCDWGSRYREVLEHRMQHGHCQFAKNTKRGKSMWQWVYLERCKWRGGWRGGTDVCERALKIEACGISIQKTVGWEDYYRRMLLMKLHNGHLGVEMFKDVGMARWMSRQRQLFKKFKQGPDKVALMLDLP